ncbi:hypothetical protein AAIB41_16540 [Brucella sp. BE17]|uniref:hypothetical protein n=1 Tax=Brucella sp. BE17 TaxID=3142977 RepID=UPI0031B9EDB0
MHLKQRAGLASLLCVITVASGCNGTMMQENVAVSKTLGTRQCEQGQGDALEKLSDALTQAGVKVLSKKQGHDGKSHISVCGAPDGRTGIFSIPAAQVGKAESVGFTRL